MATLSDVKQSVHDQNLVDFLAVGHTQTGATIGGGGGVAPPSGGDDTAALQAIAPDVRLGAGSYSVPGGLPFASKAAVSGIGAASRDYSSAADALSEILCTSATADGVGFAANPARIEKTGIRCSAASPTAGAGLAIANSSGFTARDLHIKGFYDGVRHGGVFYNLDNIIVSDPVRYGVYINGGYLSNDIGDGNLQGCSLLSGPTRFGAAALRWEGGGGMKVRGLKVNALSNKYWVNGIDIVTQPSAGATGELTFGDCVVDNYTGKGVNVDATAAGASAIGPVFDGCEIKGSANPTNGYVFRGTCPKVSIVGGGIFGGTNGLSLIDADNMQQITIDGVRMGGIPQTKPMIILGGSVSSASVKLGNLAPAGASNNVTWPSGSTWILSCLVGPDQLARSGAPATFEFSWVMPTVNSTSTWVNLWEISPCFYAPMLVELFVFTRAAVGGPPGMIAYYGQRLTTYNTTLSLATVGTDVQTHTDIDVQWLVTGNVLNPQVRLHAGTTLTALGTGAHSIIRITGWPPNVKAYS